MTLLHESVIFLTAAVIVVPLFKKLGLGAVLGYLASGALIGPWCLSLVTDVENIMHFSELGVVLLLFIIGLELQPSRLWALRKSVFGLGGLQVGLTAVLIMATVLLTSQTLYTSIVIGLVLSLSSTAFALQILAERKELTTQYGRSAFSILLFQDLAVIPLLAIIPLLGMGTTGMDNDSAAWAVGKAALVIFTVIIVGRLLLRPFLRLVALTGVHEIFSAAALLVVVGTALLMEQVGLSMALGAFLAGVLLADSEYRHELEANIEPFKGLLLGLFFIAVGMEVDIGLIVNQPLTIIGLVLALVTIKATALFLIARIYQHNNQSAFRLAIVLSQGGEFAFVLLTVAVGAQVVDKTVADMLIAIVSVSMITTPLLIILNEKVLKIGQSSTEQQPYDEIDSGDHRVIIAGFGRFGQVVARTLRTKNIPFTTLESSFEQVDFVRKYGNKVYFGDASRLDLLRAAGADRAEVLVIAIDDMKTSIKTAEIVKRNFPNIKIYARARNRQHAYALMDIGVERVVRETFFSGIELTISVLQGLGIDKEQATTITRKFQNYDENLLKYQHQFHHDESKLIASAQVAAKELEGLFEQDAEEAK